MQNLIRNGELTQDDWKTINTTNDAEDIALFQQENVLIPLSIYLENQSMFAGTGLGLLLSNDDDVNVLADHLDKISVIAISFPAFADGRGFSQARMLRDQFDFSGEIRAVGHFIQDQLTYLSRCGFNAFELLEEEHDGSAMLESLSDFTESYQAASDDPTPLFRRRA